MQKNLEGSRSPAPHVQAALGRASQAKAPAAGAAQAAHLQRALQAKMPAPAGRALAPHVAAALPSPPPARSAGGAQGAARSVQPCLAGLWRWCFGGSSNNTPASQSTQTAPLLGSGSGSGTDSKSSAATSNNSNSGHSGGGSVALVIPKPKAMAPVFLDQGETKPIPYGSTAMNVTTTTCGLVILHTEGAKAVGYHWPYCSITNPQYKAEFDEAIAGVQGTSIDVVVNGGKYRHGDGAPVAFRKFLAAQYKLPVRAYRQVYGANENAPVDPFVIVQQGSVASANGDYNLIGV